MASGKIKKSDVPRSSASGIRASSPDDGRIRFSFKLFDSSDDETCPPTFDAAYTRSLMERLRDLSSWTVQEFVTKPHKSIRNHRIDWGGTSRPNGFGNVNEQYRDYQPWQFSVSVNAHGRVHGLIIGDCFYVIWLDCNHKLYP